MELGVSGTREREAWVTQLVSLAFCLPWGLINIRQLCVYGEGNDAQCETPLHAVLRVFRAKKSHVTPYEAAEGEARGEPAPHAPHRARRALASGWDLPRPGRTAAGSPQPPTPHRMGCPHAQTASWVVRGSLACKRPVGSVENRGAAPAMPMRKALLAQ